MIVLRGHGDKMSIRGCGVLLAHVERGKSTTEVGRFWLFCCLLSLVSLWILDLGWAH
jgi:hypothetical protein